MGTNSFEFILEANRILNPGGKLIIVEVSSRIKDKNLFI